MGGCMKYRVIKSFPSIKKSYKVGDIISENGHSDMTSIAKDWPEYFEEVKERLFVANDGAEIYKGDSYFLVRKDLTIFKEEPNHLQYGNPFPCISFSTREAAEKYIDENKPMYSKKQIKEALEKSDNITVSRIEFLRIFKEKLKIN